MLKKVIAMEDATSLAQQVGVALLISVVVILLAYVLNFRPAAISGDPAHWGQFGDYVGGLLNPLLNFAVLLLLLRNLVAERELKTERGFFQLLEIHRELVAEMQFTHSKNARFDEESGGIKYDEQERTGHRALQSLYYNFKNRFEREFGPPGKRQKAVLPTDVMQAYDAWYGEWQHKLGHYFRNIFQVLKFIANSGLPSHRRKFYMDIFRAQLSTHEQVLLAYNGRSKVGEKMKPLLVELAALEHMDEDLYLDASDVVAYSNAAYGRN